MEDLANKVVIITGGAASIGGELSKEFIKRGCKVAIAARGSIEQAKQQAELSQALLLSTDISIDAELDALIAQTLAKFGKIDILINNACSYGDDGAATDRKTWLATLNVNIVSAAILGEKCRPHLKKTQGCIVNIGSISGCYPHIGRWAYPISKAALLHLTKTQAVEYAQDKIRVNLLRLGHIWSAPFEGLTKNDRSHADQAVSPFNLMSRVADGVEVARVAAFVASSQASYMTGGEIPVDGGYSAMGPEGHTPLFPILQKD